jgi:hypothetical protein
MLSIKIFKNTEIIKYMRVTIKLHLNGHYAYHNSEKFLAKVQRFYSLCAVHAYKHPSPSCVDPRASSPSGACQCVSCQEVLFG